MKAVMLSRPLVNALLLCTSYERCPSPQAVATSPSLVAPDGVTLRVAERHELNLVAQLQLDIFTDKSFASEMTQKWMSDQHSLQFHFTLYAIDASAQTAGFYNKSQIHRNSSFLDHSRTYLWYEGGNPALMDDANLVAWKSSVAAAPHRLNVTLSPFYSLPFLPASQAKTLKAFTAQYLDRNTTDPKA